jgi:hypothetical protein
MGPFIENSRKQALANVTDEATRKKYEAASAKSMMPARAIQTPKGPGRAWTVKEAVSAVEGNMKGRDFASGENLFPCYRLRLVPPLCWRGDGDRTGPHRLRQSICPCRT